MYIGLRLVDLNNYLDIAYWFKISWPKQLFKICLRLVGLNNYLNFAKMIVVGNGATQETF